MVFTISANAGMGCANIKRRHKALPLDGPSMGEGWEGVTCDAGTVRRNEDIHTLAEHRIASWKLLCDITPTLSRPHRGGGNALNVP